jgi:hypothetical protein
MILGLITDRGMSELIHQKQGTPIQVFKLFLKFQFTIHLPISVADFG